MIKNCRGKVGLMMLVDKFRLPPPLKLLVNIGVHWLNGLARLVVPSSTYWPPDTPLVALIFSVDPLRLMLVKCTGCGPTVPTTLIVPVVAKAFVFHACPGPGVVGAMAANDPE